MNIYKDIYLSDSLIKNKRKIISNIKKNKIMLGKYIITLPVGNYGILEIYPYIVLMQKIYQESDVFVIGVADSMEDAVDITRNIVTEWYNMTAAFDIKEYLER